MVLLLEGLLRIFCSFFWSRSENRNLLELDEQAQTRAFTVKALTGIMYAIWVIYCARAYVSFTPHCYDPYPSYSLFVYSVVLCLVLPQAFLVLIVASILTIFCPCLSYMMYQGIVNRVQN